jgi:diguanylate cyclase (GGDEF)-like protein
VESVPLAAQLEYLELFRGVAELYAFLLNDRASFLTRAGHALVVAGPEEAERWRREKHDRGRDALTLLDERLKEGAASRFVDGLTGLRNREYFLLELPARLDRLRARHLPVTALMIGIDHLGWVTDELGRQAGDDALAATARLVLDQVREGDVAIRFASEEILLVVAAALPAAVALAERLRSAQERSSSMDDAFDGVRGIGAAHGQPCGTLSVGVAEASGAFDAATLAERAGRALSAARQRRNAVVFVDQAHGEALTAFESGGSGVDTGQPPA